MAKHHTEISQQADGGSGKRPQYPYYSLQRVLAIATAVRDCGGLRGDVQKSVLAHQLGIDENAAVFTQLLGSARSFGLIQGWGSCKLTETAKEFFMPLDENQRRRAMLKILKSPAAFGGIIDRFDGAKLPSAELLANVLHREFSVPPSWMSRVAALFVGSAKDAGVIDSNGFLRYAAMLHSSPSIMPGIESPEISFEATGNSASPKPLHSASSSGETEHHHKTDANVWVFSGKSGGTVRLETPLELTPELWGKLNKYVQVLKPDARGGKD